MSAPRGPTLPWADAAVPQLLPSLPGTTRLSGLGERGGNRMKQNPGSSGNPDTATWAKLKAPAWHP